MGTDIHMYVELNLNPRQDAVDIVNEVSPWTALKIKAGDTGPEHFYQPYGDRNYDLFAVLADVRNGSGFAGVHTGDRKNPIDEPRGLPHDISPALKTEAEESGGHTPSYFTLREIFEYDWDQTTINAGIMSAEEYEKWDKKTCPKEYSGGIFGNGIQTVSAEEYEQLKAKGKLDPEVRYHIKCEWKETYREMTGNFLSHMRMLEDSVRGFLWDVDEISWDDFRDHIRIVFWFDS